MTSASGTTICPRPTMRRRLVAWAVPVLLFAALVAGAGWLPESEKDPFALATPRADEWGRYSMTRPDGTWVGTEWVPEGTETVQDFLVFHHQSPTAIIGPSGHEEQVQPVWVYHQTWPWGYLAAVDAGPLDSYVTYLQQGVLVAAEGTFILHEDKDVAPIIPADRGARTNQLHLLHFPEQETPCLYAFPLQDRTWDRVSPVPMPGTCRLPGVELVDAVWEPAGEARLPSGLDTVRLRTIQQENTPRGPENVQVDVWLAEHVPYPVRVEITHGERGKTTMELTGMDVGDSVPIQPTRTASGPGPALVARPAWGIQDAGVVHPFPLSTAFQAARDAVDYADLRTFLSEHPDAYVYSSEQRVSQSLHKETALSTPRLEWYIHLTDGTDSLGVRATRTPPLLPGLEEKTTFQTIDGDRFPRLVPPERVPQTLPAVADMLAHWEAYGSKVDGQTPTWGHTIRCAATCDDVEVVLWAGYIYNEWRDVTTTADGHPDDIEATQYQSILSFDGEGRPVTLHEQSTQQHYNPQARPDKVPLAWEDVPAQAAPARWDLPPPGQVAAIGAAATAVALLYWAWPTVRYAPLALFSRVHGQVLLSHPGRKAIMEAVQSDPGVHLRELLRITDLSNGALVHHLRKLEESGFIVARAESGFTCYFPKGTFDRQAMAAIHVLKAPSARRIFEAVIADPGLSTSQVAAVVGIGVPTASYHLKRLRQAGIIDGRRDGPSILLYATSLGRSLAEGGANRPAP